MNICPHSVYSDQTSGWVPLCQKQTLLYTSSPKLLKRHWRTASNKLPEKANGHLSPITLIPLIWKANQTLLPELQFLFCSAGAAPNTHCQCSCCCPCSKIYSIHHSTVLSSVQSAPFSTVKTTRHTTTTNPQKDFPLCCFSCTKLHVVLYISRICSNMPSCCIMWVGVQRRI